MASALQGPWLNGTDWTRLSPGGKTAPCLWAPGLGVEEGATYSQGQMRVPARGQAGGRHGQGCLGGGTLERGEEGRKPRRKEGARSGSAFTLAWFWGGDPLILHSLLLPPPRIIKA